MTFPAFIELPFDMERPGPEGVACDDKYPESLVRYFLKHHTRTKDRVFDPFLGFGTTAFVAEELGRVPYGIETNRDRFEWAAGQLNHWQNVTHGDAADLASFAFPKMDFCITSPPYMPCHHKWNPLFGGDPKHAGYEAYLKRLGLIFDQVAGVMKKNALVVVQADNLAGRRYTPLVRDFSTTISKVLRPEAEMIVRWKKAKPDYPHTHCLVFKKT